MSNNKTKKITIIGLCACLQANEDFEGIVDSPLCSSQSTNHNNTQRKTTGEKAP